MNLIYSKYLNAHFCMNKTTNMPSSPFRPLRLYLFLQHLQFLLLNTHNIISLLKNYLILLLKLLPRHRTYIRRPYHQSFRCLHRHLLVPLSQVLLLLWVNVSSALKSLWQKRFHLRQV
jgi:hypothetical protein